jgi:hypothetical protein
MGFADLNGVHTDITGTPSSFSNSNWVWGGGAQIGVNYYFDPSWSLDINYHYAISQKYTTYNSAPFASSSGGYTDSGTIYVNNSQQVVSQGMMVTINKSF